MKQSSKARMVASLRGALLLLLVAWSPFLGFTPATKVYATTNSSCPSGQKCVYLPYNSKVGTSGDVVVTGMEITQSVQDSQNSVPLVAGRTTVLRIYTKATGFTQPLSNIKVSVQANGSSISLSNSPMAFTTAVSANSVRNDYGSTINFALPAAWLSGAFDLTVKVDPDNQVGESNESNNAITQHLVFNVVPTLKVMIVPILYTHAKTGHTYAAPSTDNISDWIMRTYPISKIQVTWHAPFAFTGDLSQTTDFNKLLNSITTLKSTEAASESVVYYGLIPTADASSTWFYGGVAGLGWIGGRTAIGLDVSGQTSQIAAHEIGHNLGMSHTPCGNPAGPDPNFPYPDGSIGQYGLDVTNGALYVPTGAKDMMSYCNPKWISDYTYKELFNAQRQYGADVAYTVANQDAAGGKQALMFRANIRPDGVEVLPTYVLAGTAASMPVSGDYRVEVLGSQGEVLAQAPVRAYEAGEKEEIQVSGINAVIPLPDQPAAKVRLLKGDQLLAEQTLDAVPSPDAVQSASAMQSAEKQSILPDAASSKAQVEHTGKGYKVRWADNQKPALVRYSADGGKTWITLGVDVTGSELDVDAAALPAADGIFEVMHAGNGK